MRDVNNITSYQFIQRKSKQYLPEDHLSYYPNNCVKWNIKHAFIYFFTTAVISMRLVFDLQFHELSSQIYDFDHVLLGVFFTQLFSVKSTVALQIETVMPVRFV